MKGIIIALISFQTMAAYTTVEFFSKSLAKRLMINTDHLQLVADKIKVRKPNGFERWYMERSGAEASYNDKTNTILLKESYFIGNRVKGFEDYPQAKAYQFITFASTTFHELAHANFDVYLSRSKTAMETLLERRIMPWFKKNFPRYNSKIATHELFGYTAGDAVFNIDGKISDILMAHGINRMKNSCFGERGLRRIAERLNFKEGVYFKNLAENHELYTKVVPSTVYVKGKVLDFSQKQFPEAYKRELYQYFVDEFGFPQTSQDLYDQLNKSEYSKLLKKCYEGITY